jgi:hypothetical protein
MLQILLIGVIHQYQWEWDKDSGWALRADQLALYRNQRALYGAWIRSQVRDFGPNLIFDEFNSVCGDPNDRLEDTGVSWVYMDVPQSVRKKFDLSMDPRPAGFEWVREIDEPRETYWQAVIEGISIACKVEKVLVTCGLAHLDSLRGRLTASGHAVSYRSVRDELWVDENWCPKAVDKP